MSDDQFKGCLPDCTRLPGHPGECTPRVFVRTVDALRLGHAPRHPREGYGVALFVGTIPDSLLHTNYILIEIYEQWGERDRPSHHYIPYDVIDGEMMEVKLVGSIKYDPDDPLPPPFVLNQFPNVSSWKKLR